MNKIKLLLLLSITPFFSATAKVVSDKSPIGNVHHYLNNQFTVESDFCKKDNYYFLDDYCAVTSTSTAYGISNFVTIGGITNINNASGSGSYSNYTSQVVTNFIGGTPVNFTITSANGSAGMGIWIDWNNDFSFSGANEQVYLSREYVTTATGIINIPIGTPVGSYRMRVVANWLSTSPTPCGDLGNVSYGEAEDYTFTVIEQPSCMPPSNLILDGVTDATMTYSWTPGGTETSWEVIHQLNTIPAPAPTATGTIVAVPTYTSQSLMANTLYNIYVRAVCTTTDKSLWINLNDKRTSLVAIPMPWIEDFEDGQSDLVYTEGTSVNKWAIGSATACSGTQALYISNDNGVANAYSHTTTTVHAYTDIAIPANASEASFSFDYKVMGEGTTTKHDYFRVWLVPASYQPMYGTQITVANSGGVKLGNDFNLQQNCTNYLQILNLMQYAGTSQRVVFEWRNDSSGGVQPPASIDNINFSMITCPRPVINEVVKNNAGQMVLSWIPTGTETAWELVIQPVNSGAPTGTSTIIPVVGTPQYLFTPTPGQIYEFYVRAKCSDTDKSLWQGPEMFSDFNPPACAELDLTPLDFNMNQAGEYIICEGDEHVINLEADFDPSKFKSTDSYNVEQIDYAPPFPFVGGIEMNVTIDDTWAPVYNLPFNVCFYGKNFSTAQVGSNGMVAFGTNHCLTGSCAPWSIGSNVTFPSPTYDNRLRNVIMGVYQDIYPGPTTSPNGSINYQVLGTYPCRALVVNFKDINQFSCLASTGPQTSQIVIYEITNIIEVYVERRVACNGHNGGRGAIGLINGNGSQATIPPGRNVGNWSAEREAWRFSPSGDTSVTFGWYMDGRLISNNPSHQVTISGENETFYFEARVTYPGCEGGEELVLSKGFTVKVSEEIDLGKPEDIIFCVDNLEDEDRARITDNEGKILENITSVGDFLVTYHRSQADANEGVNSIADPGGYTPGGYPETIYVRVESKETGCYATTLFKVIEGQKPLDLKVQDIVICNKYALPELEEGQEYLYYDFVSFGTGEIKRIEKPVPGTMLETGDYKVYVLSTSKDGCYEEFDFNIKVFPCIIPKGISPNGDGENDYLDLADYMVQDIKIYNRYGKEVYKHGVGYTNQWNGQDNNGKLLPAGTYYYNIITPFEQFTGYIYLVREVK